MNRRSRVRALFGVAAACAAVVAGGGCRSLVSDDFRDVVLQAKAKVFPSLVYVRVVRKDVDDGKDGKLSASGSGVVMVAS